jgi:predicted DNA-binding WGR domain protein
MAFFTPAHTRKLWRVELINDTPPSNKFYWLELDSAEEINEDGRLRVTYRITAWWGKLGYEASAKSQRKLGLCLDEFKAGKDFALLVAKKIKRGYVVVADTYPTEDKVEKNNADTVEDYILFIG